MVFFNGILIAVIFGDSAFGILSAFSGEQSPKEARGAGLGLGHGTGTSAKIPGPLTMRATVGGSIVQQEVMLQAVFSAFILFAALLPTGGTLYLFAEEMKGVSFEEI